MTPEPRIAVFSKAPVAGEVKTRLVPLLGAERAAHLHGRLVERALATAASCDPSMLELWCAPDVSDPFFARCATRFGCELREQAGADLGERMSHAFAQSAPLVLIGSDCPALTATHVGEAWNALRTHDAAIAPAQDGGYVLIALARPQPALFETMAWSGRDVMAETRRRIARAGIKCAELETLWDVDRPEDYRRLERSGLAAEVEG
jgi:rSAM/selenodomain-associated transferase 1